ncbi:MAG: DUF948 domain-containing protein [Caldisericia bacterium]
MTQGQVSTLIERLNVQITAMWVLIGLLGVCALVVVLYLVPMLLQVKRTLSEAEKMTKTVNTEIMPKVNSIVTEAEPVINKSVLLIGTVISSLGSIIDGVRFMGSMFGRRKRSKKEE